MFKKMDNGKVIQFIDNRNYKNEPKFLWCTYYGYYRNPISAILSLMLN